MAKSKPTQRTLDLLRSEGLEAHVVEKWVQAPFIKGGGFRKDVGGFMDVLAWGNGEFIAAQACPGSGVNKHVEKYHGDEKIRACLITWLENGGRFIIYGWRQLVIERGKKRKKWEPLIREMTLEDFK